MDSTLDCSKQDTDTYTFGSTVTCPLGFDYCFIFEQDDTFLRSCFSRNISEVLSLPLHGDPLMDQGFCSIDEYAKFCVCAGDKCNTGFHGKSFYVEICIKIDLYL